MSVFLAHFVATVYLTGLVWTVQAVHYPLFAGVGPEGFRRYQQAHMRRMSWVAAPAMTLEAATGVWLWVAPPVEAAGRWLGTNVALLAAVWGSTWLLQVPQHQRLLEGFDAVAHRRLVATNWIRTALWTARSGLLIFLSYAVTRPT